MGKDKLKRWAEMQDFDFVIQPGFDEVFGKEHFLKGRWREEIFRNDNPITLELGCGKGEYTTGLARLFPGRNFIGIDVKGARMWRGARTTADENLGNAAFLRTRIEFIRSFFGRDEVDEIWITFPDPQLKKRRMKKRLSGPLFLNEYKAFLRPGGLVHLKTDSRELYDYTLRLIAHNRLTLHHATDNLYLDFDADNIPDIRTHYEKIFLARGTPITYIRFELDKHIDNDLLETEE